jgi:hypothetical protein
MTANELKIYVLTKFDSLYSGSAPGYEDSELSILFTNAQILYILNTLKPGQGRDTFEETEIKKQGLSALIKDGKEAVDPPAMLSTTVGTLDGERYWSLPSDFMFAIYEAAKTNVPYCGDPTLKTYNRIQIFPIQHNEYQLNFKNPYQKPYCDGEFGKVWRINHGVLNNQKIHGLITDNTFEVTEYYLRYLKYPPAIVVDEEDPTNQVNCVLDPIFHYAVGDLAIMLLDKAIRESVPISALNVNELI